MEIEKYISFIEETEKLKSILRTAWTSSGRRESTAEHSWRLALFAFVMADGIPGLDLTKVLLMSLVHDIVEIDGGDISAALNPDQEKKYREEHRAAMAICSLLPGPQADRVMNIWLEYSGGITPEAKFVKALDKAETILQHCQGQNPADFDYQFNLEYGREYFENDKVLRQLRTIIDEKTERRIETDTDGVIMEKRSCQID